MTPSERRCDSIRDATPLDGSAEAEAKENGFNFWRDVIGDDIICAGVAYSSDEWTHDGEGGVRPLTAAERSVRTANRLHRDNRNHPDIAAAYAALNAERHDALRREEFMAEAVDQWNREMAAELDYEDAASQIQSATVPSPTAPARPTRRRYRGPQPTAHR